MNCLNALELDKIAADEQVPPERLAHAQTCPRCRDAWAQREADAKAFAETMPVDAWVTRAMQRLSAARGRRHGRRPGPQRGFTAAAATILLWVSLARLAGPAPTSEATLYVRTPGAFQWQPVHEGATIVGKGGVQFAVDSPQHTYAAVIGRDESGATWWGVPPESSMPPVEAHVLIAMPGAEVYAAPGHMHDIMLFTCNRTHPMQQLMQAVQTKPIQPPRGCSVKRTRLRISAKELPRNLQALV